MLWWNKLCDGVRDFFTPEDCVASGLRCPNCDKVFAQPAFKLHALEEEIVPRWADDNRHSKDDCLFQFMKQEREDRRRYHSQLPVRFCDCRCSGGCKGSRRPPVDILPVSLEEAPLPVLCDPLHDRITRRKKV